MVIDLTLKQDYYSAQVKHIGIHHLLISMVLEAIPHFVLNIQKK